MARFVVEIEAPDAWTTRDLPTKLALLFESVPFKVQHVERATIDRLSCPYIESSDEGTSFCKLAENSHGE